MTIFYPSTYQFEKFILGGIPPNSEIALVPSLSASTSVIYARKGKNGQLLPSTQDANKHFYKHQDSNGSFAPTAKTGYKLVDLGNGTAHQWQLYGGTATNQIYNINYDSRLQPHDTTLTGTVTGTYAYRWCYVKNEVNSSKLISWHTSCVANAYGNALYGELNSWTRPVYLNDHNWRTPTYEPEHKNKHTRWLSGH